MIIKAASSIKTLTRISWKRIWNYPKGIKERINIENANYGNGNSAGKLCEIIL